MDLSVEQPLYRQQNASSDVSEELPPVTASRPSRSMTPAYLTRDIEAADTKQSASSDTDADCEPSFSSHDPFIQHVLSQFIQDLPNELKSVVNFTIKPRKMRWYIQCSKKIERAGKPHVHVQMQSNRVAVMVENRVWLKLKGPSTAALLQNAIKAMRDEAISWRDLKSEVEQCLELYQTRQGDDVDLTNVFLRAWNNLKERGINCSLPRGTHYFCGARLHHWSFVVGRVEIGSGSHEDKREAFRLAAASAAEFLLGLDDGQNGRRWRPPPRDTSSDASEDCEFLFVRDVNDESVALAATATAITLRDSPESATNDVSGPLPAVGDNEAIQLESTRQVDESAIIVIPSDSEVEDPPGHAATTTTESSSLVRASSAPSTSSEPTEVAAKRQFKLCEIIRMRMPDSGRAN
ncbi:hypothetical protein PHYPSEUDO_010070 [Phytophthora pseudosyringae]|uniref:Uncharacterized protein n=1 Tax=Phytophthora pseudosyringae TaxID=221518 RepID=A0A8T1VE46_9STRA|nr:hypothetical protein PHYPSEUDO_010070 [Phytophthora pseudosyringae]